ncbi:LPS-assembly protein [Sphaerotilus hippei]|uniref:LPS-assembly protein LptD n=2 Tax=Sphaerotilus hippei TaxID=744406 RepID=A0A318GZJ6_9BURK|nr:LPS-assembly protein [Sphaerotilus hippei]
MAPTPPLTPLSLVLLMAWPLLATPARAADPAEPSAASTGLRAAAPAGLCRPVTRGKTRPATGSSVQAGRNNTGELELEADQVRGRIGEQLLAEGHVQLRRGVLSLEADQLEYTQASDLARATGSVHLRRGDDVFTGPELALDTTRLEGHFDRPTYRFGRTDAGGQAERIDFLGANRMAVTGATYSSCEPSEGETLPWVLSSRRVRLDFDANEGIAEDAVLRFYGVPILAAPVLSFPVTDERKSGWLPPTIGTTSSSGLEVSVPYYWNIAPQYDATITPTMSYKRGPGVDAEVRYLQPGWSGELGFYALPDDRVADRERWAWRAQHRGQIGPDIDYQIGGLRVSDDNYYTDDLRGADFLTPRLLPTRAQAQRRSSLRLGGAEVEQTIYAQVHTWQLLQDRSDSTLVTTPYRRQPQVGARWRTVDGPLDWSLQTEASRFTNADTSLISGDRVHLQGSVAWPLGDGGWSLTPRLAFNAASYQTDTAMSDGLRSRSRFIPTFTLDSRWTFERPTEAFGRALTQTLEPRLRYVKTPYRDQSTLPNFDSAGLDFNTDSVFADNSFSGTDRISDAHQITAGASTRFLASDTGGELARFTVAQRFLLSDQQITPEGTPQTRRFSDLLLQASTSALRNLNLDGIVQYDTDQQRVKRTIGSVRYTPGPYQALSASYRLQRGSSEQLSLGWQWPLAGWGTGRRTPAAEAVQQTSTLALDRTPRGGNDCKGALYGVGWVDYSLRDQRLTSTVLGLEYDAGCWIGRLVAQRQSVANSSSNTKLMLQIEFVGLSRLSLGSNPLSSFKDNIPGYQMLRDPQGRNDVSDDITPYNRSFKGVNLFP